MKLLTLSKLMDYFENIVIDSNKSGPNGFEFEHARGRFDNYHPMESKSSHDMN